MKMKEKKNKYKNEIKKKWRDTNEKRDTIKINRK